MKRIAIRILSVLLLLVALYGCGGKKQAENVVPNTDTSGNIGATDVLNHGQGVEYLKNTCVNYLPWQQVRVPVSVKINSPKSLSISGTAEMVRNKSVLISLKFIGMEVAWLYVSDDVVVVADKMNKRYISESSSKFLGGFDVNTANLQDLLIGRPFVLGSEDISSVDTNRLSFVSDGGEGWSLQPLSEIENLEYGFWFEPMTVLNAAVVQYASKQPVALLYGARWVRQVDPWHRMWVLKPISVLQILMLHCSGVGRRPSGTIRLLQENQRCLIIIEKWMVHRC